MNIKGRFKRNSYANSSNQLSVESVSEKLKQGKHVWEIPFFARKREPEDSSESDSEDEISQANSQEIPLAANQKRIEQSLSEANLTDDYFKITL